MNISREQGYINAKHSGLYMSNVLWKSLYKILFEVHLNFRWVVCMDKREEEKEEKSISSGTTKPLELIEVSLNREQLEAALKKLEQTKSSKITFVASEGKLLNVDTSGGFIIARGEVHCLYGRQEEAATVVALQKGIDKKKVY